MEYGVALFTMKHDSEKGYYEMDVRDCISGMVGLMCIGNGGDDAIGTSGRKWSWPRTLGLSGSPRSV